MLPSKHIVFLIFIVSFCHRFSAQEHNTSFQLGYFAPYLTGVGGTFGCTFDLKSPKLGADGKGAWLHVLQFAPQLGYFTQLNVSHNVVINPELVYRFKKADKRFFVFSSIGTGYLWSLQRQEGTLNLGTGEMDYQNAAQNFFLPNINVGLGMEPKNAIGFFFKTTYGRKISSSLPNSAFFGLSAGIILRLKS
jgi:hypothetical protein